MLLAVDPGLRMCGCALLDHDAVGYLLLRAALVRASPDTYPEPLAWYTMATAVWRWVGKDGRSVGRVVFEQPGVRRGDGRRNRASLEALVAVGASIVAMDGGSMPARVFPDQWAGSLRRPDPWRAEEDHVAARVDQALSGEERGRVEWPAPSLRHNVYDAIGIGLWAVGRLERRRYLGKGVGK